MSLRKKEKKNGQYEQNLASLPIESPELGCNTPTEAETPKIDKNAPEGETSYDKLVLLIKDRHDNKISDSEAHRLARNLMGYCELAIKVGTRKTQKILDKEVECSNLEERRLEADVECSNSYKEGCSSAHE